MSALSVPTDPMPGDAYTGAPATGEAGSAADPKSEAAFRTIGELAADTGLPQHILRYWETRFSQLRPLQRAGNRRYYRAEDVALVRRIDTLLNREGYTVRGVQRMLTDEKIASPAPTLNTATQTESPFSALKDIRAILAQALIDDAS